MKFFNRTINGVDVKIAFTPKENTVDKFTFHVVDLETGDVDEALNYKLLDLCSNKTANGSHLKSTANALFDKMRTIVGKDPLYTVTEVGKEPRRPKTKTEVGWFIRTKKLTENDIESIVPDRGKHEGQNVVKHFFNTER